MLKYTQQVHKKRVNSEDVNGLVVLITAGGTTEKIDDVRAISNNSTGRLGTTIAEAFLNCKNISIEKIYYVCGQSAVVPSSDKVSIIRIESVAQLASALEEILASRKVDIVVHSMAVSDYGVDCVSTKDSICKSIESYILENPEKIAALHPKDLATNITDYVFSNSAINNENKLSSDINDLIISLKKTPKIIGVIKKIQPKTTLVGFKLLSNVTEEELIDIGYGLLERNSCEMVLANDMSRITNDSHTGHLIFRDKSYLTYQTKAQIADAIVAHCIEITLGKGRV
ncbi:phosphopantothenate--cysteine ligase [Ruminiclostridium papyrosolvens]|uniref:Phosphopantothenate--cysteine ligase n=1 Tax=Ruminiclostridium papyrosolvens C7 TaxID=1330534 RepID=U4R2L4_9FIRM|nr:phosphopantothenate--cysteine ligase [Ruminiclostridium papyrosolvens]EPR12582.1 phosphopantothenate--cysteine ligase [Ruminiclostridium papyrosolvens C7]